VDKNLSLNYATLTDWLRLMSSRPVLGGGSG
jgi:hypothetical protein